jgi:hypothetical protein
MPTQPFSETLFEQFCSRHDIPCKPIPTGVGRTPDFAIRLHRVRVVCEIKQIDPNTEDLAELQAVHSDEVTGRLVPNRLRGKLKNVSGQLKTACLSRHPTMLVLYDNTPFKMYSDHLDVVQAMFGAHSVTITIPKEGGAEAIVSEPFFGGNRGLTPRQNTSVSALAILDSGSLSELKLRVYHNPYASVVLPPELLEALPVEQYVIPSSTTVRL